MFQQKRCIFSVCVLLLSGCNGTLSETVVDPITFQPVTVGSARTPDLVSATPIRLSVAGVIAYRPMQVLKVSQFTQFDPGEKRPLSSNCSPPQLLVREIMSVPDFKHPIQVKYTPGVLEASQFGVVMNPDGILLNVNDQSTPDQGKTIANLSEAAANFGKLGALAMPKPGVDPVPPPANPICNATPTFRGFEQSPLTEGSISVFGSIKPEQVKAVSP